MYRYKYNEKSNISQNNHYYFGVNLVIYYLRNKF